MNAHSPHPTLRRIGVRTAVVSRAVAALGIGVLGVALVSGCAKARAETVADGPPLEVPAPPPRVIGPIDDTLAVIPLGPPVAPPSTPPGPAQQTTRKPPPARPAESEGREPAATPAPAAAPAPPPTPAVAESPRELRPAGAAADAETENRAKKFLATAVANLKSVVPQKLSAEGKSQLEEARRFVERAEEELKNRNFVFAETFADKAATLSAQLIGR